MNSGFCRSQAIVDRKLEKKICVGFQILFGMQNEQRFFASKNRTLMQAGMLALQSDGFSFLETTLIKTFQRTLLLVHHRNLIHIC
jgi:hypothetical protein